MRYLIPVLIITVSIAACSTSPATPHSIAGTSQQKASGKNPPSSPHSTQISGVFATHKVAPQYPPEAQIRDLQGCVRVIFKLDAKGRPTHIESRLSVPSGVFDHAAIETISQWRFSVKNQTMNFADEGSYINQTIAFFLGGDTTRSQSIVNWACTQPAPRVLVVSPAPGKSNIRISNKQESRGVDIVHMPDPNRKPLPNGWVDVKFCIDSQGNVTHAFTESSSPRGLYDRIALTALKSWPFTARSIRNSAVETCGMSYRIRIIGSATLAKRPVVINQNATAVQSADLRMPKGRGNRGGQVTLRFCVDKNGKVSQTKVTRSRPTKLFDQAAIHVLRVWTFWPRTLNEKPVRTCNLEETVTFKPERNNLVWIYPAAS